MLFYPVQFIRLFCGELGDTLFTNNRMQWNRKRIKSLADSLIVAISRERKPTRVWIECSFKTETKISKIFWYNI